jgi:fatty acid desaturase
VAQQQESKSGGAVRSTLLVVTVAAMIVSLLSLVAILVEYFSDIAVWPPFMAVGLWGLPLAFMGLVALVLVAVRDRRRADRAAGL